MNYRHASSTARPDSRGRLSPHDVPGGGKAKTQAALPTPSAESPANGNGSEAASDASKKRLNPIKRKQMADRVRQLEQEIGRAEDSIAQLETALQTFVSAEESQHQSQELHEHKANHAALIQEWEGLSESLQES